MAAKKVNTDPENIVSMEPAAEPAADPGLEKVLAEQQAQIEKLQEELAKAQQRRTGNLQDDAALVRKLAQEAAEAGKDPFEIEVSIRIPRRGRGEDPSYWLNVNNHSCQVPANDQIEKLRLPWAEALIKALEAERKAEAFQDSLEVYDPITNPKKD